MSDRSELSLEKHELDYILKKFGKRETENNRTVLRDWEKLFKDFKGGQRTKNYTKNEFYDFIKGKVEHDLE